MDRIAIVIGVMLSALGCEERSFGGYTDMATEFLPGDLSSPRSGGDLSSPYRAGDLSLPYSAGDLSLPYSHGDLAGPGGGYKQCGADDVQLSCDPAPGTQCYACMYGTAGGLCIQACNQATPRCPSGQACVPFPAIIQLVDCAGMDGYCR